MNELPVALSATVRSMHDQDGRLHRIFPMQPSNGPMTWMSYQLAKVAQDAPPARAPSPLLGKWRNGRTSEAVFAWLACGSRARLWWTREEITTGTGCSEKAVDWALLFLRGTGAVTTTTDPRCGRYHRYRVVADFMARLDARCTSDAES